MKYQVVEKFVSINGEGRRVGQLSVFIRFKGCNLNCAYCDTKWANEKNVYFEWMTQEEIYQYIKQQGVKNVTLTGGEPLLQDGIGELLEKLSQDETLSVEIETNGSVDIREYQSMKNPPIFTMDYKLGASGQSAFMNCANFERLLKKDTVKFVVGSEEDLEQAREIMKKYGLIGKCGVYLSPVFGSIEPVRLVDFLLKYRLNEVNVQLQLHKFIWDPSERGV